MAKNEFALAFNEVLEEKQLAKDVVVSAIESAMVSAYRRAVSASTAQHVEAKLDPETGVVTVYAEKEVVEDSIIDARTEVLLDEARKVNPEAQPGDMVVVETTPADFGRVAAQTARQVIQQRIREAERSNQMQYFERQVGEIVSGLVQASNAQGATIGLDMKAEGVMPNNQKIPGERLKLHDRIRAVVMEVKDGTRGPQIILSRAHRNFLRRLLENEVPEIYHGIVEIRAIAREPGARAKVAVSATQAGIDPVGACVGIKGVRIQAIVKELHDEKIDIIQWDQDPITYISKAISPARVEEERSAAARADIPAAAFQMPLDQAGIKEHIFNILTEAGFETVGSLMFALKIDSNKVLGLAGIGSKAMQNIEESLAALTFPEPVKVEEPAIAEAVVEPVTADEMPVSKKQTEAKEDANAKRVVEEEEHAKDGVSLDELFKMKPEIFQTTGAVEEDPDKKKGKKGKKKAVELEFDEKLGTVVGRKIHKRGDEDATNDWE